MTVILDISTPRTLLVLVERLTELKPKGTIEAWLFEDEAARRAAERRLSKLGITAKLRSAYKPLVHYFLEELDLTGATRIVARYPVDKDASPKRFTLEAYPLAALIGNTELIFEPAPEHTHSYDVIVTRENGTKTRHEVFAPNRIHKDAIGETQLSPTGWLRIGSERIDERIPTDFETLYEEVIKAVTDYSFGREPPFFDELNIRVTLPSSDRTLDFGNEAISVHEAMHEDLYFSLLELFQRQAGFGRSAIQARPGHIVPQVSHSQDGPPSARVETRRLHIYENPVPHQALAAASHPLSADQIRDELLTLSGDRLEGKSRAGRVVRCVYKAGSDAGVVISGGQHANETTGIVGALRAAQILNTRPEAHFAVSPLENPDGYALHHRLRAEHSRHMHHAARYTALGDDVESREDNPILESVVRAEALARTDAKLHLNLHGYPAHEWTRPLSGYLPHGFELWTLPKGFFLVVRHHPEWAKLAEKLVFATTERLADVPGLVAHNRRQIEIYEAHAGPASTFQVINGFPCWLTSGFKHNIPLTLITEFPDETIYGDEFVLGHTAQMETVVSAYDAYQALTKNNVGE